MEINLEEVTEKVAELKDIIARCKFEQGQAEKELERQELKLIAFLEQSGTESCDFNGYYFGWKTTKRKAFDQKLFGQEHPDLLEKFKLEKESTKFEFKINK